nr:PREDICTED: heme-binding protein 2-like [Paralichthys olivaceus]
MMLLSGVFCLLMMLTAEAGVGNSSGLLTCTETEDCLLYDLISDHLDFEERHYESVKWVSTNEMSFSMDFAAMDSFKRLLEYFDGANDNGTIMAATFPVLLKIPFNISLESAVFIISFLLPAEYQTAPPSPMNDMVYIHETPNMTVFTKSYDGWMTVMSDNVTASSLSFHLNLVGVKYIEDFYYAAIYNDVTTEINRYNEVWFVGVDESSSSSSSDSSSSSSSDEMD